MRATKSFAALALAATILLCLPAVAREAKKSDMAGTVWRMKADKNTVMAGEDIVVFTDSTFSHRFYWPKTGAKKEFVCQRYQIAAGEMTLANGTRYLMSIDDKDGHLTMNQEDCLPMNYEPMSQDELAALETKTTDDLTNVLNVTKSMTSLMAGATKTVTFILEHAGSLGYNFLKIPNHALDQADKIKICGPMNGDDIEALRAVVADSTALPNIKTLDLSRAWIVTDSATFHGYVNNGMTHEYFAGLKGRRSQVDLPPDIAAELGAGPKVEKLQDAYGYALELIPDKLYISFTATIADCVMKYMLAGMPYVEHLRLPETTRNIHYGAISNCPKLQEITIPQNVRTLRAGVFNDCQSLATVRVSDRYHLLDTRQFNLKDTAWTAFLNANPDVRFEEYTFKRPEMSEQAEARFKVYSERMKKLRKQRREQQRLMAAETHPDSIKTMKQRREDTTMEMARLLAGAIRDNRDNSIAGRLLGSYFEDFHPAIVETCLLLMNDSNALSPYAQPAWQYLKDKSSVSDVDWNQYADITQMESVHVERPGTLSLQKTTEEWAQVRRLYVSGQIDSTDVAFLCTLAGGVKRPQQSVQQGALNAIDLSEASLDYLPDGAFAGCRHLRYIRLPEGMRTIGRNAFIRSSLASVVLPASLRSIRYSAFLGCRELRSMEIPDSVVTIASSAFADCRNLRSVKLSERLDTLGMDVFAHCPNLQSLHLPRSLRSIGINDFLYSQEIELTIDPANENFEIVEGQIVGKTARAKENLSQLKRGKPGKSSKQMAIPANSIVTYKMVNGKKVFVGRRPIK